ncbi:MAG: energy transducer TonB [Sphingobacteriaceae bacterium]|nr:energy transducer TonB [Sphingobacteriaceae bacterium]
MKTTILSGLLLILSLNVQSQENTEKTNANKDEVFTVVDDVAEFKGGNAELMKYLQTNLKYPEEAKKNKIGGTCFIKFIVAEDGKVNNVQTLKGVPNCAACDKEAVRVIEMMPTWNPAKINGKSVKSYYNLPIRYKA